MSIGKSIYFERLEGLNSVCGAVCMSWKDIMCLCVIVIGIVLFLYGSNYYNAMAGWTGVYFIIGGFFAEIILKVYESVRKKEVN